jgi:phage terminase Nu1 subunit (DNA packaging protein)
MATIAECAKHLFMDERRFKQLLDEGVITRQARASYDMEAVREQYIRHQREVSAGRVISGDLDPAQERARKDKELADKTALTNAATRRDLLPRSEVHVAVTSSFARVRSKMLALPTKLAPLVLGATSMAVIREKISDGINEALAELAATRIAGVPADDGEPSDTGRGTGLVADAGATADADGEPVGRQGKAA